MAAAADPLPDGPVHDAPRTDAPRPDAPAADAVVGLLTRTLAGFGLTSAVAGLLLATRADGAGARAFGQQSAAWGAVNLGIAGVSALRSGRSPVDPVRVRRILLVNAALDLGYIAAGAHIAAHRTTFDGRLSPQAARGHGLAVVAQGLNLLNLDLASPGPCPEASPKAASDGGPG